MIDRTPTGMQPAYKEALKLAAATEALKYVAFDQLLGVGSGSTVNLFVSLLRPLANQIKGAVAASEATAAVLREAGIRILDLNDVDNIPIYVDGADEVDAGFALIKGGGAALTREKIIASASDCFVCVVDSSKLVTALGTFPLPPEVIPIATSLVCRRLVSMGAVPTVRPQVTTDNGNVVIDAVGFSFADPLALETELNQLPGVVCNGIFARRHADVCISANQGGILVRKS